MDGLRCVYVGVQYQQGQSTIVTQAKSNRPRCILARVLALEQKAVSAMLIDEIQVN